MPFTSKPCFSPVGSFSATTLPFPELRSTHPCKTNTRDAFLEADTTSNVALVLPSSKIYTQSDLNCSRFPTPQNKNKERCLSGDQVSDRPK